MTGSDAEYESEDPRLVTVVWPGRMRNGLTLHRHDDGAGCGNRPETNTSTDLTTAAVFDGHELCQLCEWPDGCEEVIEDGE